VFIADALTKKEQDSVSSLASVHAAALQLMQTVSQASMLPSVGARRPGYQCRERPSIITHCGFFIILATSAVLEAYTVH